MKEESMQYTMYELMGKRRRTEEESRLLKEAIALNSAALKAEYICKNVNIKCLHETHSKYKK